MKKVLLLAVVGVVMVACSVNTVKSDSEKNVQQMDMQRVADKTGETRGL